MNIVYVLAHPDDAEIWCGGTILKQIQKGDNVKIVYLYSTKERKSEALQIMKYKVKVEFIKPTEKELRKTIKDFNTNIIVTHWFKDCHHEHKDCFYKVYNILPELLVFDKLKFSFFVCDTYNSIGFDNSKFMPNTYVDISKFNKNKKEIIRNHTSQPCDYFIDMVEKQNKNWGIKNNCKLAESYLQLPVQGNFYEYKL